MPVRAPGSATTVRPAASASLPEHGSGEPDAERSPTAAQHLPAGDEGQARRHASLRRTVWPSVALVVVLALLGALAGLLWGHAHPVQVQGRSDVLVESNVSLTGDLQTFEVTERDVTTQQTLIASPTVVGEASRRAEADLADALSVSAAPDSNILTLQAVRPTRAGAREATDAYVRSYLALVAARQKLQVDAQLALARASVQSASDALTRLDAAVAATPPAQQPILLTLQSAERSSFAQQQRDGQEKVDRLQDAASRLPVNLQRVDRAPVLTSVGFTVRTWTLLGLAAGLVVAVMVVARLAERRP